MKLTKETAVRLVEAIRAIAAREGKELWWDGRNDMDGSQHGVEAVVGSFYVPTVEELDAGMSYRIEKRRRTSFYGADRNSDTTIVVSSLHSHYCSSNCPPLDEEGAEELIKQIEAMLRLMEKPLLERAAWRIEEALIW